MEVAAVETVFKRMLLITIFSELTVTFDPGWTVTRTGRFEEKVTPANLRISGSEVVTW